MNIENLKTMLTFKCREFYFEFLQIIDDLDPEFFSFLFILKGTYSAHVHISILCLYYDRVYSDW